MGKIPLHIATSADLFPIPRPETVESLFLAYRSTGDEKYREQGWKIFQAFERHCKVPDGGYASIENVEVVPALQEDKMETFWLVSLRHTTDHSHVDSSLDRPRRSVGDLSTPSKRNSNQPL